MNVNEVRIGGGLVRDPELHYLPSGIGVCEFTVVYNGARYDSQARQQVVVSEFIAVQAWGWLAEQVAEMGLAKGDEVLVLGQLTQREIEKKDGTKEKKTRVVAAVVSPTKIRSDGPPPAGAGGGDPWQTGGWN